MEQNETKAISLGVIFQSLLHHAVLILIVTAVFAVGSLIYTTYRIPKVYRATVSMMAIANPNTDTTSISVSEQNSSIYLTRTYAQILTSNSIMRELSANIAEKGMNYSDAELSRMISTQLEDQTWIFKASVKTGDPDEAKLIADALADVASVRVPEITGYGKVAILDYAKRPASPYSPSVFRNVALAAVIGFVLSAAYAIIRDLTDTTIWTEENLTESFGIPVLGIIPQMASSEKQIKKRE